MTKWQNRHAECWAIPELYQGCLRIQPPAASLPLCFAMQQRKLSENCRTGCKKYGLGIAYVACFHYFLFIFYCCPLKIDMELIVISTTMGYDALLIWWLLFQQFYNHHNSKKKALWPKCWKQTGLGGQATGKSRAPTFRRLIHRYEVR